MKSSYKSQYTQQYAWTHNLLTYTNDAIIFPTPYQPLSDTIYPYQHMSAPISYYQQLSASTSHYQPLSAPVSHYQPLSDHIGPYQPLLTTISHYQHLITQLAIISPYQPLSTFIGHNQPLSATSHFQTLSVYCQHISAPISPCQQLLATISPSQILSDHSGVVWPRIILVYENTLLNLLIIFYCKMWLSAKLVTPKQHKKVLNQFKTSLEPVKNQFRTYPYL